ncbi:MAG: hypothetical protein ACLPUT_08210 [Solirubrobacteraceae bacterium]
MPAAANPLDYFEYSQAESGPGAHWSARASPRPSDRFDLKLLPRSPTWREDASALDALSRIEREPWAGRVRCVDDGAELRLDDGWIEAAGAALQDGDGGEERLAQLARGERFSVQFCDAPATEALNVGHLRNLALGNALAAALDQAGANVERRSLISDAEPPAAGEDVDRLTGQRETLDRLGIAFDRVFFASDFPADAAELAARALALGASLPAAHLGDVAYWLAAPKLEGTISIHVCGAEWVSRVAIARQVAGHLLAERGLEAHPTHEVVHGEVSAGQPALASGEPGALAIEELAEWLEAEIEADPRGEQVLDRLGSPERAAAQVALGYFLPHPAKQRVDLFAEKLLRARESPGWDLACARASGGRRAPDGEPARDPDYRFAVVQAELHSRQLRLAVELLDPAPLARHVVQLARWYLQRDRSEAVERVTRTALDVGARGLGLE